MKWSKILILTLVLITLAACKSQYKNRMVRVKPHLKKDLTERKKAPTQVENNVMTHSENAKKVESKPTDVSESATRIEEVGVLSLEHDQQKQNIRKRPAKFVEHEPQDSSLSKGPSEEFIKDQYRKANNYSIIALILFLATPLGGITFIGGIVMAILAIRIYRKYKNPGVRERYILAVTVLVLSILTILATAGLLYLIFIGL